MTRRLFTISSLAVATARISAQNFLSASGLIRIWGDGHMADVIRSLEEGFRKHQPNVRFETSLMGTGTAMAGLYTGVADLAFMGRTATPKEIMAFEWVFRYKPQSIEVMTGSVNMPGKSPALVVFVHKNNPISKLTLAQLDAIFGCERRRGLGSIRTWGQFGLAGDWADKAIHAYSYNAETGSGAFFQQTVLKDSRKWNWDAVKEFRDSPNADAGRQILDALSRDPYGIAVSCLGYENALVKPLALAGEDGDHNSQATAESLVRRSYPLTRVISVYLNRPPEKPPDRKVQEFLRYILGREGQDAIARDRGYLPLGLDALRDEVNKLVKGYK